MLKPLCARWQWSSPTRLPSAEKATSTRLSSRHLKLDDFERLAAVGRPKGSVTGDRLLQKILQGATTRVVASGSGLKR